MKRRSFLGASVAALAAGEAAAADSVQRKTGDLYELRVWTLKPAKQEALDAYLSKAYLPALTRCGVGPVGVFADKPAKMLKYYVLAVHQSAETIVEQGARLA